jgi:cell division protein DivIC
MMRLRLRLPSFDLSPVLRVLAVAALLYFGFLTVRTTWQAIQVQREMAQVHEETRRLQERLRVLEERQRYAQSEEFIERVAREQLNLIKPGETAIIVLPAGPAQH